MLRKIICTFSETENAENAVKDIINSGIPNIDIEFNCNDSNAEKLYPIGIYGSIISGTDTTFNNAGSSLSEQNNIGAAIPYIGLHENKSYSSEHHISSHNTEETGNSLKIKSEKKYLGEILSILRNNKGKEPIIIN